MVYKDIEEKITCVNPLTTPEERRAFAEYAAKVPDNGKIVEIGTAEGSSAFSFAFASKPSVKVYTIDPNLNEKFLRYRKEWNLEDKLVFINKTSEDAAKEWEDEIDLLFIDGIHNYQGVMNDFNWFSFFVKPGGYIMFHDYYYYDSIKLAVDDLEADGEIVKVEIVDSYFKGEKRTGLYIAVKTPPIAVL